MIADCEIWPFSSQVLTVLDHFFSSGGRLITVGEIKHWSGFVAIGQRTTSSNTINHTGRQASLIQRSVLYYGPGIIECAFEDSVDVSLMLQYNNCWVKVSTDL